MENLEKCTVAMLGGPCSQHVTGNTSWQNQPQSAVMDPPAHGLIYVFKHFKAFVSIKMCAFMWYLYNPT